MVNFEISMQNLPATTVNPICGRQWGLPTSWLLQTPMPLLLAWSGCYTQIIIRKLPWLTWRRDCMVSIQKDKVRSMSAVIRRYYAILYTAIIERRKAWFLSSLKTGKQGHTKQICFQIVKNMNCHFWRHSVWIDWDVPCLLSFNYMWEFRWR